MSESVDLCAVRWARGWLPRVPGEVPDWGLWHLSARPGRTVCGRRVGIPDEGIFPETAGAGKAECRTCLRVAIAAGKRKGGGGNR